MIHEEYSFQMETKIIPELEQALSLLQCELVARRNRFNPEAVNWAQYDVLEALRVGGTMRPSVLSEKMGISRAQLSKALRVLKDQGLVEQSSDQTDRRAQVTKLSSKGEAFMERASLQRHEAAQLVAAVMTLEDQLRFSELCNKAVQGLQSQGATK